MAALTLTKSYAGELAGDTRLISFTVVPSSATDTITLTAATAGGVTSIVQIVGCQLTGGVDANLCLTQLSFSGLVLTLKTFGADGLAATDWTSAGATITLLINTTATS